MAEIATISVDTNNDGVQDTTIETDANTGSESGDENWQSTLLEVVRDGLSSGFQELRNQMQAENEAVQRQNSQLMESNTALTAQIAETNRTLLERLPVSIQPATVVLETPAEMPPSDTPNQDEEETVQSEVELESQEPPPPTKRKRRTL